MESIIGETIESVNAAQFMNKHEETKNLFSEEKFTSENDVIENEGGIEEGWI